MGGVGDFLFGNSGESASLSANHAWDMLKNTYAPATRYTTMGGNAIASLLGVGGGGGSGGGGGGGGPLRNKAGMGGGGSGGSMGLTDQTSALDNWANSGGMQFLREQGNRQINSNQAARGLLNSGSTLTALTKYGQGLGSTYLNQYMDNLFKLSNLGISSGALLSDMGRYSKGSQEGAKPGALSTALSAGAMIPGISDIRLKRNIVPVGQTEDGLGIYDYELIFEPGVTRRGVMAHEVRVVRPHAFVENAFGKYDGVDYQRLGSFEGVRE